MRFFKYLIFLVISVFSTFSYALQQCTYTVKQDNKIVGTYSSLDDACSKIKSVYSNIGVKSCYASSSGTINFYNLNGQPIGPVGNYSCQEMPECWHPDYKIVSQPISSLKKVMCLPVNGAICKYTGDPTGSPIINGSITTTFSSVSKTSDPSCKEELVNPPCDPKDPYGGCFTPPNDNCTRQFNGSIECPADTQPPIEKGCNGATYCDRPPQGCGQGYVSGSFNGKQICIKTSPSTGSGDGSGTGGDGSGTGGDGSGTGGDGSGTGGDGSGTGTGNNTGTGTGSSTSTNTTTNSDGSTTTNTTTTVNNFSIDFSPLVNAVNKVSDKLTNFKNELLTSISDLSNQIGLTNNKIDSTNSKLTEINDSSLRQEDLLKAIRDKESPTTGGDGSPSYQPASGASIDLTETNGLLTEIRDGINSIKDVFSDEGKAELEQIGQASNDSRYLNAQGNAQSSLNNLANKLTFGSSACLSDFQIQLPIFGSVNIALSQWCPLLALLKILLNLIVLLTCLRMLDATVRTI